MIFGRLPARMNSPSLLPRSIHLLAKAALLIAAGSLALPGRTRRRNPHPATAATT